MMGGRLDDVQEAAWRAGAVENGDTIAEILRKRRARLEAMLKVGPNYSDLNVSPARPTDHSFWWAETKSHGAVGTQSAFRDDGLHFWAGPKVNDWDGEMHTSLGAVASFTLQPDRFPTSPSGLFRSSPHMELFGGVVASAPDYDLLQGNGIAECKLFLRQTIFQFGFGQSGPEPRMIAEASGYNGWRIYLKNTGHSERQDLPGYTPIPEVTYAASEVAPNDLFVEVEARLDIYLNCAGALVWCDPEVLMRTFQWEPTPLP